MWHRIGVLTSGKSVRDIIDRTLSNKVRLQRSGHHFAAVFQVELIVKLSHLVSNEGQPCNLDILLHDQIVEILFLVTTIFHFTLKFFELFKCFKLMLH